jgi:predicted metal-dependent peptidase
MADHPAVERCRNSVMVLGFSHPHFLLIHAKIRDKYTITGNGSGIGTMGISVSGRISLNPEFVQTLDKEELAGVLAHEMLHLVLSHHERKGGRDSWIWNIATDMCINQALKTDNIKMPRSALYPPHEYQGDLFAETLFDWLVKNPQHVPPRPKGDPMPGAGCSPVDDTNGTPPDWRQTAIEARAMAQQAGKGTCGVSGLLAPRQPKIDWRKVIRSGFQMACSRPGRDYQTFSKRHRRSPADGVQFAGWHGLGPRIAVCVDVSGSMDRKWVEKIVAEIKNLLKQFPGTRCYMNAHTSDVVWSAWITDQSKGRVDEMAQFSGGTDPNPAYQDIKEQGRFDSMCHFTDCEFFGEEWPTPPARHLIVGAFTRGDHHTKPPPGATVIPCDIGD